jgi:hypothetical protein
MVELDSQVHKSTKNFKKLQVSLDDINRVLGLLRESFTLLDKGSLHEGGSGRRQQLVVHCSVIDQ